MTINEGQPEQIPGSEMLDWDHAVRITTALLDEHYVPSDRTTHPIPTAAVQRLAALLCAYGKLGEEIDRWKAPMDEPPVSQRPTRKQCRVTPAVMPFGSARW